MPNTARGIISSVDTVNKRPEAPRIVQRVAPDEVFNHDEAGQMHRYVTNQGQRHQIKIVPIKGDKESEALVDVVLGYPEHYNGVFQFFDWAFATPYISVAKLLDKLIRAGIAKGVSRDMESIMLRCASCDQLFPNTEKGRRDMTDHQIYDHFNDAANYFQPQSVGGTNAMGFGKAEATEEDLNPEPQDAYPRGQVEPEFGEEFSLTAERVPEEVAAVMETEDGNGNTHAQRVGSGRQNKR